MYNGSRRVLKSMDKGEYHTDLDLIKRINDNLYDGEVAFVDRYVGELIAQVDSMGLSDDTVVIVTSDHGEGLWKHHEYRGHGEQVYQQQVHVPLTMRWPGRTEPGERIARPVGVIDLFGTFAEEFGLATPDEHETRSLFAPPLEPNPPIYIDELVGRKHMRSVIDWPWKLILRQDGGSAIYRLDRDPSERRSLDRDALPAELSVALGELERRLPSIEGPVEPAPEPAYLEQLRALGYVQ